MAEVALAGKEAEDLDTKTSILCCWAKRSAARWLKNHCCVFPRHPLALVVLVEVLRQAVLPNLDSL
jgi:hypothetical protein